ncbi:MAG: tetratricopeptide repeat protein [Casimicrobiaceae bacterium]
MLPTDRSRRRGWVLAIAFGLAVLAGRASAAEPRAHDAFAAELDATWDYARPAVSEARFRESFGAWSIDTAQGLEMLTQVARAQGLQGRYEAAHATLDQVEARLAATPSHVRVRYLLERGRVFNSSGQPHLAAPLFRLGLELAECADDAFYAVDAAHMLGIAAPAAERLDWNLTALALAKVADDARARRWLAPVYNNIAWSYLDAGDAPRALAFFRKALPAWEARGDSDSIHAGRWALARALRATGQAAQAEKMQRALLAEHTRAGTEDGYVFEELAELALARGDQTQAHAWFARAWRRLRDDPALAPTPERLQRMAALGGIDVAKDARR